MRVGQIGQNNQVENGQDNYDKSEDDLLIIHKEDSIGYVNQEKYISKESGLEKPKDQRLENMFEEKKLIIKKLS